MPSKLDSSIDLNSTSGMSSLNSQMSSSPRIIYSHSCMQLPS